MSKIYHFLKIQALIVLEQLIIKKQELSDIRPNKQ